MLNEVPRRPSLSSYGRVDTSPSTKTSDLHTHRVSILPDSLEGGDKKKAIPLRHSQQIVPCCAFGHKTSHSEPARAAVMARTGRHANRVAHQLAAGRGVDQLGGASQVADQVDAGERGSSGTGGGKGTGLGAEGGRDADAGTEKGAEHGSGLAGWVRGGEGVREGGFTRRDAKGAITTLGRV